MGCNRSIFNAIPLSFYAINKNIFYHNFGALAQCYKGFIDFNKHNDNKNIEAINQNLCNKTYFKLNMPSFVGRWSPLFIAMPLSRIITGKHSQFTRRKKERKQKDA